MTKLLLLATCGLSIFVSTTHTKSSFELYNFSQLKEFWRIFTQQMFFQSSGELLFGTILLYQFRLFERQLGTSKFLVIELALLIVLEHGIIFFPCISHDSTADNYIIPKL